MKKVLVALAMIMGLGTTAMFAQTFETPSTEQTSQVPQDEFVKMDVKDLPQAVIEALAKKRAGAGIKEVFVADKETGKVYKIVLIVTKEDRNTIEETVFINEKGEFIEEQDA
ncbi:hypothetical protein HMPREF1981_03273 [Bacteroides pyogenes F0041]|uniref:PepSY domain-containing protein n=1 Tax=Bacteroides pyogenes F0041 TaxID=1321819 RepID=U2DIF2_9BACE|nr:hypothetical protein [Bacteroides pyogenes]ERI81232.1 hypothetical protein HMPREF1981_03273 [Bacteroides pyogenes F0041]MBB3894966.1 hypothetical protein [Bacteroides pyogenes]GAE22599.1 hypothetical protein JCM10003_2229 [Bacteroides pyogenes JCM 10003]SUV33290.1 Protein of uncharacterised function (DUF2874) [Bacteroides pyogenes]